MRLRPWVVVFLVSLAAVPVASFLSRSPDSPGTSGRASAAETESWRAQRERDLKSDTGWLTVASQPIGARSALLAAFTLFISTFN